MPRSVFLTASGSHLPGMPVPCDRIEDHIGRISPEASRRGRLVLRRNRIVTRHYAMDADGRSDWTVAKLGAAAAEDLLSRAEIDRVRISYLATATTQNDLMVPGLASGVHAALGLRPLEIASHQSVCASSMMALKAAWLQVAAGEHDAALAIGAEFSSRYFRPGFYTGTDALDENGVLAPDAEFLRWTLSDGAGGVLLETRPAAHGLSLRVDWISLRSFADRFGPCMTGGSVRSERGIVPWSHFPSAHDSAGAGAFMLRQDAEALHAMLAVWLGELMRLIDEGRIATPEVDWFLCHYSAHSLREEMVKLATRAGCMIPEERWFTNLYEKGNVGAASIYLLIDDLLRSGRLEPGQTILCAVPESGQCVMSYARMTVVEGKHE
jgi:3-oxoacyl-[acyl-carrier-protein] synthase-3